MSPESFHTWLRYQLDRREMNASDLARKMDIRPGVISHWVRGERIPSSASCERIADALNVDPDLVLVMAGHRPNIEGLTPDDPRTDLIAMVRRVRWTAEREAIARSVLEAMIAAERTKGKRG